MLRFQIVLGALITMGCMLGPATASAQASTSRPLALVKQFGEPDGAPSEPPIPENHLTSEMEREFSALNVGAGAKHADRPAEPGHFLPIPIARVPAWMRTGGRPAVFSERPSSFPSPSANCASRVYIPSSLLGRDAEERRRILYPLVQSAACEAGLPVGLMDAMLIQESRYNPLALSPKGAFGLGQLMPGTALQLGVDRYDLSGNLAGAARYLRQHIDEFRQVPLALAAYNAGPGRVRKTWSIPRITETQNYVRQILSNWRAIETGAALNLDHRSTAAPRRGATLSRFR